MRQCRPGAILVLTVCLVACARPAQDAASSAATPAAAQAAAAETSPCALPGAWTFRGGCVSGTVNATGGAFEVPSYNGLGIIVTFGASDAASNVPFVLGDATGGDVDGTLLGHFAFPWYGSVPCLSPENAIGPCKGRALVYLIAVNAGNVPVQFAATPEIEISRAAPFPASQRCTVNTLTWADASHGRMAWIRRPPDVAPIRGDLRFAPVAHVQTYASGGQFSVFAVTCR